MIFNLMKETMKPSLNIINIEDCEDDSILIERELHKIGSAITFRVVDNAGSLKKLLTEMKWDLIISDYTMPSFSGLEAVKIIREFDKSLPVIIVSGTISESTAKEVIAAGADGVVMKYDLDNLVPEIERVLK